MSPQELDAGGERVRVLDVDEMAGEVAEKGVPDERPALCEWAEVTGHGAREASYVQNTRFDRLSSTPNEIIKIRYDSFATGDIPLAEPRMTPNFGRNGAVKFDAVEPERQIELLRRCCHSCHLEAAVEQARMSEI